ncbi:MAG: DUF4352 domain-containing protein [Clostridiales bacterium]|nr:DUF4352 domain-containing protein [Clostridiales bacterium]
MKRILCLGLILSLLLAQAGCGGPGGGEGEGGGGGGGGKASRSNPAKIGETVSYSSMKENSDAFEIELTLLEVYRGGGALKMAKQADSYNDIPKDGKEYLFAKFKVSAVKSKNDEPVDVPYLFDIVRADGSMYEDSYAYIFGLSELSTMYAGASQEGFICFEVDKADEDLLIVFPLYSKTQVWFSAAQTSGSDDDDDYNPLGDPNRVGSKNNPAELGVTANFNGMGLSSYWSAYSVDITVTEINRGQRALDMVTLASSYNDNPPSGKEYMIVKVKIEAIDSRNDTAIDISGYDFSLFNSNGIEYRDHVYVSGLEDTGFSKMYPGATQEGYLVYYVDANDPDPCLVLHSDSEAPVWISVAKHNASALIDPNALGTRNNPVPLNQAFTCTIDDNRNSYKVELKILDQARGSMSEQKQKELGLYLSDINPGNELIVIYVQASVIDSTNDAKVSIDEYDFELVSKQGVKYKKIHASGNPHKFTDMYKGATQDGIIFFQVSASDAEPLVVFKESYSQSGTWFSLD